VGASLLANWALVVLQGAGSGTLLRGPLSISCPGGHDTDHPWALLCGPCAGHRTRRLARMLSVLSRASSLPPGCGGAGSKKPAMWPAFSSIGRPSAG